MSEMEKFINPYNFIPFIGNPPRRSKQEYYADAKSLLSGWIDVTIIPKSPLIITDGVRYDEGGNVITDDDKKNKDSKDRNKPNVVHTWYKAFRNADGKPAIPGSSLRGAIRSMYEAASNSCASVILDDKEPLTIRMPEYASFKHRGLLVCKNRKWILYPAVVYTISLSFEEADTLKKYGTWNGKRNAQKVKFNRVGQSGAVLDDNGQFTGYLQFNVPAVIPRGENHYHIAVLVSEKEIISYDNSYPFDSMKQALDPTVKAEKRTPVTPHKSLLGALEAAKKNPDVMVPVWYLSVGSGYYFSPAAIGRVYQGHWEDIMSPYAPCSDKKKLCPACALFGTIADKGMKGRLRFSDAVLTDTGKAQIKKVNLPVLAAPQPSAYAFYATKPTEDASYWNYAFYSKGSDDAVMYYSADEITVPRGRKGYWHSNPVNRTKPQEAIKPPNGTRRDPDYRDAWRKYDAWAEWCRESTMEAVMPGDGVEYKFRLFFDRVTAPQLKELEWVLTFGSNKPDNKLMYKLGHGRPVGYGSVKMVIDGVTTRKVTDSSYVLSEETIGEEIDCPWDEESKNIRAILNMAAFDAVRKGDNDGVSVAYPRYDDFSPIYKWFAENHKKQENMQTLPDSTGSRYWLWCNPGRAQANPGTRGQQGNHGQQGQTQDGTNSGADLTPPSQPDICKVIGIVKDTKPFGTFFTLPEPFSDAPGFLRKSDTPPGVTFRIGDEIKVIVVNPKEKNDKGKYDLKM